MQTNSQSTEIKANCDAPHTVKAQQIVDLLREHDHFLVAAHGSPDGDAIGATGAMGHLLQALGKSVVLYNANGLPDHLSWVPLSGHMWNTLHHMPFKPKVAIVLDSGDAWRLGNDLADVLHRYKSINIDHHRGNPEYGTLANWVDPDMAACGQMVAALADAAGIPLRGELAKCVYLSLVSDTGSFTHGNTTAAVFSLAARLVEAGLDAATLRDRMDNTWTLAKARLWGNLLERLRLEKNGAVCLCAITLSEIGACGAGKEDMEGFVEQMRRIRGVRVAMLLREDNPRRCKVSLRSSGSDDVRAMAARFSGGGHTNAAGATLDMSLAQAIETCLKSVDRVLGE